MIIPPSLLEYEAHLTELLNDSVTSYQRGLTILQRGDMENDLRFLSATLHRSGNLVGAAGGYRSVLVKEPDNADALHLLGVITSQKGDLQERGGIDHPSYRSKS